MTASNDKYQEDLKHAAEFLIKGGTLLSESCEKCSGIQVKKNNEITCIICGNKTTIEQTKSTKDNENHVIPDYGMSEKIVARVRELIMNIGSDKNLVEEELRLRVIVYYIKVLEKIKHLN